MFDKASGDLVLTGIPNVTLTGAPSTLAFNAPATTLVTAYVDLATGRVRFNATPNGTLTATFQPLARRLTNDSRADTSPVTFLDGALKANDSPNLGPVVADRRWYIWRKSGVVGPSPSATIYYKTQRLTAYLPQAIDVTKTITVTVGGSPSSVDAQYVPPVYKTDGVTIQYPASTRLYFPVSSGAEGQTFTATYTDTGGTSRTVSDVVQWQDELRSNDTNAPPTTSTAGLDTINSGYIVPLNQAINEDNVSAFLDPDAYRNSTSPLDLSHPHKVWLFWNSTRNGMTDIYSEAINPLFTAGP